MVGLDIDQAELEALCDRHGLPPNLPSQAWRTPVPVFDARGRTQVGQATSGTYSPVCKRNLALATVRADCAVPGRALRIEHTVEFARHTLACTVVARPFFDPPRKRA
jgi:aminomethyltransferase